MNSVLLIGHSHFTDKLRSQVRGLDALTVTAVSSTVEAITLVEKATPDIIIVQGCVLDANSVVRTFGRHQIAHIVIIETVPLPACSLDELNALQLEKNSFALESGADAYLWLPFGLAEPDVKPRVKASVESSVVAKDFSRGSREGAREPELTSHKHQDFSTEASAICGFTPNQCRLIQAHIQIGLGRAQRYRDLSRINDWLSAVALVDALTQINNRRSLDLELPNQIKTAQSNAVPLSLMILDIDYFKSVNDRFGHLVGDDILRQLAQRLLENMRFYDTPFRFGGEEVVITLNNTDAAEGSAIANRLREIIANKPFTLTHPVNEVSKLVITVSIGLTQLQPDDDKQGRSLLDRADKNLLLAKSSGRNQVVPIF